MIIYNATYYVNLLELYNMGLIEDVTGYFQKLPEEVKLKVVKDEIYEVFQKYATILDSEEENVYVVPWIVSESDVDEFMDKFDEMFLFMDLVDVNYLRNRLYLK